MRQRRSQPAGDADWIDVTLVEDAPEDEFLTLLHELALEAIALRAASPGDARSETTHERPQAPAPERRRHGWPRRVGSRRDDPRS